MKTATIAPTFLRSSVTEKLVFPVKPSASTRRSLRMSGFRWSGFYWYRTQSQTGPIKPKALAELLTPANDNAEPDINDILEAAMA